MPALDKPIFRVALHVCLSLFSLRRSPPHTTHPHVTIRGGGGAKYGLGWTLMPGTTTGMLVFGLL